MPAQPTPEVDRATYEGYEGGSWNNFAEYAASVYPDVALETVRGRYRRHKSRLERTESLGPEGLAAVQEAGLANLDRARMIWLKTDKASVRVDLPPLEGDTWEYRTLELCEEIARHSPKQPDVKYKGGHHLFVLAPADIHMGKLAEVIETGETYNLDVARDATKHGVGYCLRLAAELHSLDAIIVNTGNDGIHVDNTRNTTTSGTPQDTAASYWSMCDAMFWTWVWVIEAARLVAPVRVVFDPSNHPWLSDWHINKRLEAYFRSVDGVTFDPMMQAPIHRKYVVYGSSLIGFSHGDGAKEKDLPNIMQHEARQHWGRAMRGYWIVKHTHHKSRKTVGLAEGLHEKDHIGVTVLKTGGEDLQKSIAVEVVRSPSATDGWHHRNGFIGALKAIEGYVFHHTDGNVARFTKPLWGNE